MISVAQNVPLPPDTPIPCLVCKAETVQTLVFSGTVQLAESGRIRVFNGKTHQTMGFIVPAGFHGVESSDGQIAGAPVSRIPPGLLARVTYRTVEDRRIVTRVLLLTINQCRSLKAAESLSHTPSDCPD
jgi:hypothetical protein